MNAVEVRELTKRHFLYPTPMARLRDLLHLGHATRSEFIALRDVSFDVAPGEVLGVIGENGSGKSTLLQLLAGTVTPTSGSVQVRGRIGALLELGTGFDPECTGRENAM